MLVTIPCSYRSTFPPIYLNLFICLQYLPPGAGMQYVQQGHGGPFVRMMVPPGTGRPIFIALSNRLAKGHRVGQTEMNNIALLSASFLESKMGN